MKLLKEADKISLYEAALYDVDLLENSGVNISYGSDRVTVSNGTPCSIADLGVDWKFRGGIIFDVSNAHITSCEGFPSDFVGSILIQRNLIKDLKGMPERVYGEVWANANKQLASLEGAPKQCEKLYLSDCEKLTSLEHCPEAVDDVIAMQCHNLVSLKGLPTRMKLFEVSTNQALQFDCDVMQCGEITFESNNTSLKGFDSAFKGAREISFGRTPIKSHILGLLRIDGLKSVHTWSKSADLGTAFEILNRHLPSTGSMKAILECQDELIEAGLDEFAKL